MSLTIDTVDPGDMPDREASRNPDFVVPADREDGADSTSVSSERSAEQKAQATRLVELAANVDLFHDSGGETYARYAVNGHFEVARLNQPVFKHWLCHNYYFLHGGAASNNAVSDALNTLIAKARYAGDEREVRLRVAALGDKVYLDLCDDAWRVVEIGCDGWCVIDESPVMFRRANGMLPLPEPMEGGALAELREYVNISEGEWPLLAAWLVASIYPNGPYPILQVDGEQGSAKTTLCRLTRMLIDPNKAGLRSEPSNVRDLVIAAGNSWVICLDNLSRIPPAISDAMCRLATGGGFSTRKLYENDEEAIFDAQRPQIVNGITGLATRGDLIERVLMLNLPAIPADKRRSESEILRAFEERHPYILGGLLTALSGALRKLPETKLEELPRMADFALIATAAEEGLGLAKGDFMQAYNANRSVGNDVAMEASPVGKAIMDLVENSSAPWIGNATELLKKLEDRTDTNAVRAPAWPKTAAALGQELTRLAPNLRSIGIELDRDRTGKGRDRTITIKRSQKEEL